MNKTMLYGAILMTNSVPRYLAIALSTIVSLAPFFVAWLLGVSMIGVMLGVLVASLLSGVLAVTISNKLALGHQSEMPMMVVGYASMLIGVSLFVGLSAAFLIVTTPLLFMVPMSYGLRAWAISRYQDATLWESLS